MSKILPDPDSNSNKLIWILASLALIIFCLIFFVARGKVTLPFANQAVLDLIAPFQRASSWATNQMEGAIDSVKNIVTVYDQNKILKKQVEELRSQSILANEIASENLRLRELLNYKNNSPQFNLVVARVIGRESATWTRIITIDKGSQDGIQKNMPVVTSRGLVGVVSEVGTVSSQVSLILDVRTSVGALVQRSRVAGIVEGNLSNPMQPNLTNIPHNEDVHEGDLIITSGLGGVYPKGILIGTIKETKLDRSGLLQVATIEPAVDFQRLEDVIIVSSSTNATQK